MVFRQFVLKVASQCNLACDYCYVYRGPDQTWRSQPRVMSPAAILATADRIGEHMRAHDLSAAYVSLHGGEPLLAGIARLEQVITAVRAAAPPGAHVHVGIQSNGVLLDHTFLRLFARHGVRVGISLDGASEATDRHRRRADGRPSHHDAVRAVRLLGTAPYHTLFAGLLATIDLANDPVATYRALAEFAPPSVDFLLPHGNWTRPPPGLAGAREDTPYADWLMAIFDHWYIQVPDQPRVRIFDEVIQLLIGGTASTESIGAGSIGFVVIETDGTIEGADSLKSAYHGAAATGLSVFSSSFDDALSHPPLAAQQAGRASLCQTCLSCPVVGVCGGGQYAHRYRTERGFANPSVYCADLRQLIWQIGRRVYPDMARAHSCDTALRDYRPPLPRARRRRW